MFHKILFSGVVLGCVTLGLFLMKFSQTDDILKKYQRYGFIRSDIRYEKVEKKWGQEGLIFYQLEFPGLKVPHRVGKMALSMNDNGITVRLANVQLNVKQAMQKLYATQSIKNLDRYTPYRDFFNRILTSLAVMGVDEFMGDIALNTTYRDLKTVNFDIQINQEKKSTLKIDGIIRVPSTGKSQLTDLYNGQLENVDIQVQNKNWLKKYIDYAKSRKIETPESLKKGILSLKNLSQKLPKLSDIMR